MTAAPALLPSLHALVKEWRFEAQDYTDRYAQACRQHAEKLEALLSRAATTQAGEVILRSDLEAIRKAVQEEMLRVTDMAGGRRVETCLQLDSARSDYGWLYARHADGQWVTIAKLDGFSIAMIQAEANAFWQRAMNRATATANSADYKAGGQP